MTKLFLKYLSIILTIYLLSLVFPAIWVGSIPALLAMGLVLLIVNLILKPILLLITLPLNLLTLGLFSLIVNAWTIMIADSFVANIRIDGFLYSFLAAFIIVCFNQVFTGMMVKNAGYTK
ncbi:phage holin family protein [Acetobacterium wieringae]|uniref:phage holin family protein n=1 Tax=Acetobacterium wieringae TaxID=52694 RepID=UPI0026F0FEB4|nr:phage holin family protein [Acetobacterium wieringae]